MYCPLNNRVLFIVWRHTLVKGCALQSERGGGEEKRRRRERREKGRKREREKRVRRKRKNRKTEDRKEDNRQNYLSKAKVNGEDGMSTSLEKVVAMMVYPFVFETNVLLRNACNGT